MPSNILTTDTSFPQLSEEQSTDEKFRVITDYLYILLEQLRYSMANLGRENFNDKEFDDIVNLITEPVYAQLSDAEGNIAALAITAEQLISRMSDAEGNISVLQQTSDSIMSQVTDLEGNVSTLQQTSQSLTTRITNAEGSISSLTQTVNGFSLEVSNGSSYSTIRLMSGSAQISSQRIQMTGMVTFTDLETEGRTTINGANLETGTVTADTLRGSELELLDSRNRVAATFELEGSSSTSGRKVTISSGAIEMDAVYGDIFLGLYSGQSGYLHLTDNEVIVGLSDLRPNQDDRWYCGTNANRWSAVYAASPEIVTSDRNKKNSITYDMSPYDALFDRLKPTPYKYNEGTSGRTHLGMISQDVEEALTDCGLDSKDFAGFVKGEDEEKNVIYSLRYEEFIALCIDQIQKLKRRVDELEGKS